MHPAISRLHNLESPTIDDIATTINMVRDDIDDELPPADQIRHLLDAVLTENRGPLRFRAKYATKSGADNMQMNFGSKVRFLVTGSIWTAFMGEFGITREEADRLETLAVVLFAVVGKRAYGVERWQRALGISA